MNNESASDGLLRRFLLDQVDEDERQRVELLFTTGSLPRERLIAVEENLIDDYLDNSLAHDDMESFLSEYGDTSSRQRKLRIARSLKEWARTYSQPKATQPSVVYSKWSRTLWLSVTVAATVLIGISVVWFVLYSGERSRLVAVEQHVQQLNDSATDQTPSAKVSLSPVSPRTAALQIEISAQSQSSVVRLQLLWMQKQQFSKYQATLRKVGENRAITVRNLKLSVSDGAVVELLLPPDTLSRGLYRIELSGMNANGVIGASDDYGFAVSD